MPLFEFDCLQCKRPFEILTGTAVEGKKARCPHCQSARVRKRFSAFGVSVGLKPCSTTRSGSRGACRPHECKGCH